MVNPNSAFTRVMFDLPTPIALQLDDAVKASGKSKKQYLADLVSAAVSQPAKRGSQRASK